MGIVPRGGYFHTPTHDKNMISSPILNVSKIQIVVLVNSLVITAMWLSFPC